MDSRMASREGGSFGLNRQYSADDLQRLAQGNSQAMMSNLMATGDAMGDTAMTGTQNMGGMSNHNLLDPQRRNTYHPQSGGQVNNQSQDSAARRISMMEFGTMSPSDLDGYQFTPNAIMNSPTDLPNGGGIARRRMEARQAVERQNSGMSLDAQFPNVSTGVTTMSQSPMFQNAMAGNTIAMDTNNDFMNDMDVSLDMGGRIGDDISGMGMYANADFPMSMGQMDENGNQMMNISTASSVRPGNNAEQTIMEKLPQMKMSDAMAMQNFSNQSMGYSNSGSNLTSTEMAQANIMQNLSDQTQGPSYGISSQLSQQLAASLPQHRSSFSTGPPMTSDGSQTSMAQYPNAYSSTGFDMLGVLMRVATRPNAQINIGAVDMSCAFVVCDFTQHDIPIVYCSEMFERLTGYSRHEILGRNCRFLQAPDGKVQSGLQRKYVDDSAVLHLKNMISLRSEAQISLINYRKGGQPFMNLLTMIPISWEKFEGARYYVGFQVDLVEQPTSITNKNPDGTYSINYQRGFLPSFHFNNTPETNHKEPDPTPVIERDDVAMVLSNLGSSTESEATKRMWDKVLLENTDDVLHVLSLKGLFLYLSQASKKVLEYEPHELVGTALSSVCHPSDIVPVTRELKDTIPGATVNVVFRIRRKFSGYTWFESHGSLHTEQGKGKKCIILVGRERPVYALRRSDLVNPTILGENELWTKMSTSGMFLYVSSHSRSLLDRQPDEMVGTSAQSLMRPESKAEFNKMLELARVGIKNTFKHDIQNKRGQTLHAQTTLYPGDAVEGQKPTFLVAQTKLLKMTRGAGAIKKEHPADSINGTISDRTPMQSCNESMPFEQDEITPQPTQKSYGDGIITSAGGQALAVGSQLQIMAQDDNVFDELKTTRSTSWQFELRQMEKKNRVLAEEMQSLISLKKKRKRRKGIGQLQKDCANCHTRSTPEWRRGPSGNRDLCNSCGLRWAKQNGRVSPRTHSSHQSDVAGSGSPQNVNSGDMDDRPSKNSTDEESPQRLTSDSKGRRDSGLLSGVAVPEKIEEVAEPPD